MGSDGNYIKINRKILDWEWYSDINTCRLFLHMLLKANWKESKFRGYTVPRGSFVSSIQSLAHETSLTNREIRTGISHLKTTGEVTIKTTNKFTIFTVLNYDLYQANDKQDDKQETNERQTNDKLTTTIEERKKERKEEYINTVSDDTVRQTEVRQVIDAWNQLACYGIKSVTRLSSGTQRYERLMARIKQYGIDDVMKAIQKIQSSSFLQGKTYSKKPWIITFDWFVLPNNFPKVLDGNYDDTDPGKTNIENSQSGDWQ